MADIQRHKDFATGQRSFVGHPSDGRNRGLQTLTFDALNPPIITDDSKGARTLSANDTIQRPVFVWASTSIRMVATNLKVGSKTVGQSLKSSKHVRYPSMTRQTMKMMTKHPSLGKNQKIRRHISGEDQ